MRQRLLSAWAKHAATTARERREKDIAEKDVATRQIAVAIRVQAFVRAHRGKEVQQYHSTTFFILEKGRLRRVEA